VGWLFKRVSRRKPVLSPTRHRKLQNRHKRNQANPTSQRRQPRISRRRVRPQRQSRHSLLQLNLLPDRRKRNLPQLPRRGRNNLQVRRKALRLEENESNQVRGPEKELSAGAVQLTQPTSFLPASRSNRPLRSGRILANF